MSLRPDGAYRCDRCDADVANAAVTECAIVTDRDADGNHQQWHFCRQPAPKRPHGCAGHLFGPKALAAYHATKESQ